MFKYLDIKVGADPELFLTTPDGKFFPSCGLVGGSKDKPKKIDKLGHAVQEDNVMVEYNIRPAKTKAQFIASHKFVLAYLKRKLPKFTLVVAASAEFDPLLLKQAGPQALMFGCDPDYNAWTWEINSSPEARTNLRTAGGHIHVGYKDPEIENQVALIRAMDLFIGVPSVVLDPDRRRRDKYGKAGAFRPKEYGAEFRTPSNFWIKSENLMGWAFDNTHRAVEYLNSGKEIDKNLGISIQHAINLGNVEQAEKLSEEFNLLPR